MKVIILAGGKGTRLHPFTAVMPKPLMPIDDMPVLELLLRRLKEHGFEDVILAVNHLQHLIRSFFGDGSAWGLRITYALEDKPLGTAGPIGANLESLTDDFIVCNGDLLTNLDFANLARAHRSTGAAATVATHLRTAKMEFGALTVDADGQVSAYVEKPSIDFNASMGMYVLNRSKVREFITPGAYLDMPDLIRALIDVGAGVYSYGEDCVWLDIGQPDDYAKAQELFATKRSLFLQGVEPTIQD